MKLQQRIQVLKAHAASDKRAQAWYGQFSVPGLAQCGPGSRALAEFCLAHRDRFWHLLHWRRHPRAPTTLAQKPGYFSELLVLESVHSLLQGCQDFWESEHLTDACCCSAWVLTDTAFATEVRTCNVLPMNTHCRRCLQLCSGRVGKQLSDALVRAKWLKANATCICVQTCCQNPSRCSRCRG
jgi:hypothetical protein